ncbi:unnamed protein product [Medioppia subpectinata]|uniref:Uncharacterized protein n=1 Tax=Medioppia subpectinata TaxID=1979941 RepID=A0A7R9KNE8_9ACAR|nr:unnamed protein product [Medioppia subpectinata]CAG2105637.1 unnamed protein product [Medioppia subpectinata]
MDSLRLNPNIRTLMQFWGEDMECKEYITDNRNGGPENTDPLVAFKTLIWSAIIAPIIANALMPESMGSALVADCAFRCDLWTRTISSSKARRIVREVRPIGRMRCRQLVLRANSGGMYRWFRICVGRTQTAVSYGSGNRTLTGNYGNILPVDWSKTYARSLHLPALNINASQMRATNAANNNPNADLFDPTCDEEELANKLDMHSLILASLQQEPIFTAEQVLEEIDEIMMNESESTSSGCTVSDTASTDKSPTSGGKAADDKHSIAALLYEKKLKTYSSVQLNELYVELERTIQHNSGTLINELAPRDEFEMELKNTFISLLLSVQNKRRQHTSTANGAALWSAIIQYNTGRGQPIVATLQILIKILRAINEDSPTVPTLLTDYLLKWSAPDPTGPTSDSSEHPSVVNNFMCNNYDCDLIQCKSSQEGTFFNGFRRTHSSRCRNQAALEIQQFMRQSKNKLQRQHALAPDERIATQEVLTIRAQTQQSIN